MSSLKTDFSELMQRIRQGREFAHASFEPIFYLVFHPSQILEVKRQMLAWVAKLRNEGWNVTIFSIAQTVGKILSAAPLREVWVDADRKNPLDWTKTNKSLANALTKKGQLQARLVDVLAELEGKENAILLVTDLEALHPYVRIGAIEAQLQGKFHVPTVFQVMSLTSYPHAPACGGESRILEMEGDLAHRLSVAGPATPTAP